MENGTIKPDGVILNPGINMKNWLKLIYIFVTLVLTMPLYAYEQEDDDHDKAKRLVETGEILSLQDILIKVREIHPGKILEVELENKDQRKIYEIELLRQDGTVLELKFDAKSGKHLSTKKED